MVKKVRTPQQIKVKYKNSPKRPDAKSRLFKKESKNTKKETPKITGSTLDNFDIEQIKLA